ncbi:unnamed protein product [Rotaria magnacalcarata]|uniref:Uncharacterized protein n=1 Tax=Rotaria magnacalcarata TaxID=392030 RepID=A0A815IC52_9BILA|nr:unnamed protein product [Rotaria magnacalcarata]CAF5066110.1 unnamed protein product [Rotaria magnacalcarata]
MLYNSGEFDYLRHQLLRTSTHAEYDKTTDNLISHNQTRDKNMKNQVMKLVNNNESPTYSRIVESHFPSNRDHEYCSDHWNFSESQIKTRIDGQDDKTYPGTRSDKQSKTQPETGKQT